MINLIKELINKVLKNIGNYEIRKIIPDEFKDLKKRDLKLAYRFINFSEITKDNNTLEEYKNFYNFCISNNKNTSSQSYQDLFVIWKLRNKSKGFFVEFGADNGILNSNSYLLEKQFSWEGILVEANPLINSDLKKNRACKIRNYAMTNRSNEVINFEIRKDRQHSRILKNKNNKCKNSKIIQVTTITLNDLLEKYKIKRGFELLSIDIEGNELDVLKGFDIKYWKPKIIIIEHNYENDKMRKITQIFEEKGYKKELELFSFHDFWFTSF